MRVLALIALVAQTAAVPILRVWPEYPPEALKARVRGVVIVRALVEKNGTVGATRVEKPLPFGLGKSAEAAVRQWKFKPCRDKFGRPMRCSYLATVRFQLP